jgi:hypothetical protein
VMKETASKSLNEQAYPGGFTKGDVANHGNSRFDRCPMASPPGKVESIPQISFCTTSRERVWSPYHGLEKHSQLRERHPSCNVEEGPQSVCTRDTCYGNDKAGWQWRLMVTADTSSYVHALALDNV